MSGFDAAWLALREPVDHVSRNAELAERVRAHFADRPSLVVADLGSGTGSNLRALAPLLPPRQHWRLIDADARLLEAARRCLVDWAEGARPAGSGIELRKDRRRIEVSFECADLVARDLAFADVGAELVTAAALFDLVSQGWLEKLAVCLARRGVPLYSVLNYDGLARWRPAAPLDGRILAAFNRHQRGDKGFGPALGPAAGETLRELLVGQGYAVSCGASPWELGGGDGELIARLAKGFARAAAEIEPAERGVFAQWAVGRVRAVGMTIGHCDVFATI